MRGLVSVALGRECPSGLVAQFLWVAHTVLAAGCYFDRTLDGDPGESRAAARNAAAGPLPSRVTFNRFELNRILNLYGRMVADGEWRDYAIDFLRDRAVFSVFRRASEVPIYRIEKDPRLARKQGIYSVISASGLILRRGHELDRVLLVIDRKLAVV